MDFFSASGRQVGISPATPDIVRKPTRASGTTAADGSCCTALYTSAAAGPRKVDSDCLASVPSHAQEHSQSAMPEDLGQVDCDPVGTQESSTLPPLVGESSGNLAQQEQQQHQEEGVASGSDAGAASPAHTPPGRWSPHLGGGGRSRPRGFSGSKWPKIK